MASPELIAAVHQIRTQIAAGDAANRSRALATQKVKRTTKKERAAYKTYQAEAPASGGSGSGGGGGSSLLGDVGHALGDVGKHVGKGLLTAVDVPRRAVFGGAVTIGDLINTGHITDRAKQALSGHYTGADLLGDAGVHSGLAKTLGGLAVDIGSDPLAYLSPAVKAAEVPSIAAKLDEAGHGLEAAQALRSKSVAGLSKEALAAVGEKGGIEAFGKTVIPQDMYSAITKPTRALRGAAGDLLDRSSTLDRIRGTSGVYKAAIRSGDPNIALPVFRSARAQETEKLLAAGQADEWITQWKQMTKGLPDDASEVIHALEDGDRNALGELRKRGLPVDDIRDWYTNIHATLTEAGVPIRRVDGYVPRWLSDEMKALKSAGGKGTVSDAVSSLVKARKIGPGADLSWLKEGLRVPDDLSQGQVRAWVNGQAREILGRDFYSTDLKSLGNLYARQAGRVLGDARWKQRLESMGLAIGEHDAQSLTSLGRKAAKAGAKADVVAGKLDTVDQSLTGAERRLNELANASAPKIPDAPMPEEVNALRTDVGQYLTAKKSAATYGTGDIGTQQELGRLGDRVGTTSLDDAQKILAERTMTQKEQWRAVDDMEAVAADWLHVASQQTDELQSQAAALRSEQATLEARLMKHVGNELRHDVAMRAIKSKAKESAGREIDYLAMQRVAAHADWRFQPAIADALQKVSDLTRPRNIGSFWQHYDKVQGFLKTYQLLTPGFHFRNTFGGLFNNALADIDAAVYPKWLRANRAWGSEGLDSAAWKTFAEKEPALADAYQQARRIAGYGQYGSEIPGVGGKGFSPTNNPLTRVNKRVGEDVEHFLRGSLAMDALLKGRHADDAVQLVEMFHFNYGDLTSFESNLKRVVPFYTWTRRNLPLQLEMMFRRPSVYSKYNAVARAVSKGVPMPDVVPNYYNDQGAIPTPLTEQGQRVFWNPTNTLPVGDVLDNPLDPSRYLSMVSPILKTPLELDRNKQFFKGIPLTGKHIDLPAAYQTIPGLMPALEAVGVAHKGKVREDAIYTLDQFLPFMSRARRLAPSEKKYQERTVTQWINFMFGAGLRTNTKSEQTSEKIRRKFAKQGQ